MQVHCSSFPFKTSGHSIALFAMCLLCTFTIEDARGQTTYDEFTLSGFVVAELGKALAAYEDAQAHCGAAQTDLRDARRSYRETATSGARNTLIRLMDERDYFFLLTDLALGRSSPQAKSVRRTCNLDNGVNRRLLPMYERLYQELRKALGARSEGDILFLTFPRSNRR